MSSNNPFARVLSIRDRRRHYTKNREDADHQGLFTLDETAKSPSREEDKKIEELRAQLEKLGLTTVPIARLEYVVRARGVDGDLKKAYRLLMLFEDSAAGVLKLPDPTVRLLGAENRERVTCYLDSLLFAMFARVDVFEAILFNHFEDEPRKRLVTVLRLWINMLRTGRLITTDITQHLQESLAECGWADAAKLRQQDASEAFCFITDKLNLPLVTLKTDLFHAGKEDTKDDHKFITERMLDVAIPENIPANGVITLERCLEDYFNNRVEVKRELQRRNTATRESSGSIDKGEKEKGAVHVEVSEVPESRAESPQLGTVIEKRPTFMLRERATSIFSERHVTRARTTSSTKELKPTVSSGRPRAESVKKEVLMPAWQFLNLIPWYTDHAMEEKSQLANHFSSRRPMLGICLKRYKVSNEGTASRLNTKIDIPMEMASPHFADEEEDEDSSSNFKLVLQAVVCHRGNSVNAGHYIALARTESTTPSRHGSISSGSESQQTMNSPDVWLRMDDLAAERVTTVNIQQALKDESPYILFYRIQPISEEDLSEPPPYTEPDAPLLAVDQKLASLPETRASEDQVFSRPSIEIVDVDNNGGTSSPSENRLSSGYSHSLRTDPQISEGPTSPSDEQKGSSLTLSKQPSTVSTGKSRQSSESSEKRLTTLFKGRLNKEKAPKPEPNAVTDEGEDRISRADAMARSSTTDLGKGKSKERRSKLSSKSRRGSLSQRGKGGGIPDRDCIVM